MKKGLFSLPDLGTPAVLAVVISESVGDSGNLSSGKIFIGAEQIPRKAVAYELCSGLIEKI